jgi:hypothetical protein
METGDGKCLKNGVLRKKGKSDAHGVKGKIESMGGMKKSESRQN